MPIFVCPFPMIDNTRRNDLHIKIGHNVAAYHHGALLTMKHVYNSLQRMLVFINIIAIELYSIFSTLRCKYPDIPTPAYSEFVFFGDKMNQFSIRTQIF